METVTPEDIIAAFYKPSDENVELPMRVKADVEITADSVIFGKPRLDKLSENLQLLPYLCAILGCSTDGDEGSGRRRILCFFHAISYLKRGCPIESQVAACIDRMLINLRFMSEKQCESIAVRIVEDFNPSNEASLRGYLSLLDFLGSVVARCSSTGREDVTSRVLSLSWPPKCIVMLAATAVELVESEDECNSALQVISSHIRWGPQLATPLGEVSYRSLPSVEPEELPALFYQLTNLGKKTELPGQYLRRVVMTIAGALDCLLLPIWRPGSAGEGTSSSSSSSSASSSFTALGGSPIANLMHMYKTNSSLRRRVDDVLANIVHHMSMVFAREQGLAAEVATFIRNRWLSGAASGSLSLSPGRMLLCFLSTQASQQRERVVSSLREFIYEVSSVGDSISASVWYQDRVWHTAMNILPEHFCEVLELLTRGALLIEVMVAPLLTLAFSLIDSMKATTTGPADSVNMNLRKVDCAPWVLGAWLIVRLFCNCSQVRSQIIKDISFRLLVGGSNRSSDAWSSSSASSSNLSSFNGSSSQAVKVAHICVLVLGELVRSCSSGLLGCANDLQEAFSALPELHHETASGLIDPIGPLFFSCPALGNRCALALRKASFSKDCSCRQAAVTSLLSLLQFHLVSSGNDGEDSSRRRAIGLSSEEIVSLLRRFLHHQSSVRSLMYCQIGEIYFRCPASRPLGLRLLSGQLESLLVGYDERGGRSRSMDLHQHQLDIDKCFNLSHRSVESVRHLILSLLVLITQNPPQEDEGEGSRAQEEMFGFSQMSQPSSQIASQFDGQAQASRRQRSEAVELNNATSRLLKICKCACELDYSEYSIYDALDADPAVNAKDYCRAGTLGQLLHCCLIAVSNIDVDGSASVLADAERIQIITDLFTRLKLLTDLMSLQMAKITRAEAQSKPKKKSAKSAAAREPEIDAEHDGGGAHSQVEAAAGIINSNRELFSFLNTSKFKGSDDEPNIGRSCLCELQFVATILKYFNKDTNPACRPHDEDYMPTTVFQFREHAYLHRLALECADRVLSRIIRFASQPHATADFGRILSTYAPDSNSNTHHTATTFTPLNAFIDELSGRCQDVFALLLEDIICFRRTFINDEQDDEASVRSKTKKTRSSTELQLMFQSMLNCVRAVKYLERKKVSIASSDMGLEGADDCSKLIFAKLSYLLNNSFALATGNPQQVTIGNSHLTAFTALTAGNFSMAEVPPMASYIKKLFHLMLAMQNEQAAGWQAECPVLMNIIGEFVSVLPESDRSKVVAMIFSECGKRISLPSPAFSQALLDFFLLKTPSNPAERSNRAVDISKLIQDCCEADLLQEEGNNEDLELEADSEEKTFTLLSKSTLSTTCAHFVSALEKAVSETGMLLKLRERGSCQRVRAVKQAAQEVGRIDSDDEGPSSSASRNFGLVADASTEMECITLKRVLEACNHLISSPVVTEAAERIIGLFSKLYKLHVKIARNLVQDNVRVLPRMFRVLAEFTANAVHPLVQDYLSAVHADTKGKFAKQAKVVPELIFQMEQLDVILIRLSNCVIDKAAVRRLIKKSVARDFKIDMSKQVALQEQEEEQEPNAEAGEETGGRKQKKRSRNASDDVENAHEVD